MGKAHDIGDEVTTQGVARAWGVSRQRVYERMGQCGIKGRNFNGIRLWPRGAVETARPGPTGVNTSTRKRMRRK